MKQKILTLKMSCFFSVQIHNSVIVKDENLYKRSDTVGRNTAHNTSYSSPFIKDEKL